MIHVETRALSRLFTSLHSGDVLGMIAATWEYADGVQWRRFVDSSGDAVFVAAGEQFSWTRETLQRGASSAFHGWRAPAAAAR